MWTYNGHTTGLANDAFLAVNGHTGVGVFYRDVVTLETNTNYVFGTWIRGANSASPFTIGIRVFDATNLTTPLVTISSASMTGGFGTWRELKGSFNTGSTTGYVMEV